MKFYYSDIFNLNLPDGHRFPGSKYSALRQKLLSDKTLRADQLHISPLVKDEDLARAHSPDYIADITSGTIDPKAMRRIGFPWSPHIVKRARATLGGAVEAARSALATGLSGQLAGGTHHAHYDFGAGFCVFNDFAVAALHVLNSGHVQRVGIIDLDVHQGDGNAAILAARNDVFILSLHGEKNFPFRKVPSDMDVNLDDGIEDDAYMRALQDALPALWAFKPDIVFYQAGVDPLVTDTLGRMNLTHKGLAVRDRLVLKTCKTKGIPVSMAIGGGYANPISDSVTAYANTYEVAKDLWGF